MSAYFDELTVAMNKIAFIPNSVFIGQAVACPGTAMSRTLENVSAEKKIELPVFEDTQMGMAIGLSLRGMLPVCVFPRWNFLLIAMNQLVLHLDKLPIYSRGGYRPKVIIRTAVASEVPLDPGPQHLGDFSEAVRMMLATIRVYELRTADDIRWSYQDALERDTSTILVEYAGRY